MKKGLLTLSIVAIALLCSSVYAYAPIIGEIPDVLIGDAEDNPSSCVPDLNFFRFTDAFNFDEYVTADPGDPDAGTTYPQIVRWSFMDDDGPGFLKINGILALANESDSVQPDLVGKELTAYPNTDPLPRASSLASFRDLVDSPEPDAAPYSDPSELTCLNTIVTIYASNGSKTDSREIIVKANVNDSVACLPDGLSFPVTCTAVKDWTSPATEGWVARGVGWPADNAFFATTADGKPFYVTTHTSSGGNISASGHATRFVYGLWRSTGTDVAYVANNVYRIQYVISSTQTDITKVPNCRLLTYFKSPTATIMAGGNRVGKGLFPPDADGNAYNVYIGPPDLTAAGATFLEVNFEVIDFDANESGTNTMDECHICRFDTPEKTAGTLVKTYTTWTGFSSLGGALLGTTFANATVGSTGAGLFIQTPLTNPTGKLVWAQWSRAADATSEIFEADKLYRSVYTMHKAAGGNIGKIRMINSDRLGDWNAKIALIPDQVQNHMPQTTDTEYSVWIESMPALYGTPNEINNRMSYMFDTSDGSASQGGQLFLSQIELYSYDIP
jgi:hypothetical protein